MTALQLLQQLQQMPAEELENIYVTVSDDGAVYYLQEEANVETPGIFELVTNVERDF